MSQKYFKKNAIGVDLGGTKIAVGFVSPGGQVLEKKVETTKKEFGPSAVINQMVAMTKSVLGRKKNLFGIGIGAPGPLDQKKGLIFSTPNLPGWRKENVVAPFKREFKAPVFLDNDANAAALAEWKFGAGKGARNMIYLTISTGIGGGIIIDGKLYRGMGNAGEIGHMVVDMKSEAQSGSGIFGDLESLASGTGIAKMAKIIGLSTSIEVFDSARKGHKKAKEIIARALNVLGVGLVNCIHVFDPELIVLGGSVVINNQDIVFPFLRDFVKKNVMPGFKNNVKIVPAKLGSDSGLVGAAALVFESLGAAKIFAAF